MQLGPAVDNINENYFKCNCTFAPYSTYFGAYDTTRCDRVKSVFQNVRAALNGNVTFVCGGSSCDSDTYAYTTAAGAKINLCPQFFRAGASIQLNSQPGTLLHELTHWTSVGELLVKGILNSQTRAVASVSGGTRDIAYGDARCKALASGTPDTAVKNADK